ncbi:putative F-box/LRR-repeat protein at3g58880 [Phtheirospermum japonicum]|uniref:Putative F-box/LRR-repeat protein at3g58880 n=1 Tax=Phtheirospermum japonicum TaxID=374723 RepID=A0A830BSF0_9LAMI|nr:putative F-box/LRR-repeat protein at3g58880 [Phtheirospermum japonicum]
MIFSRLAIEFQSWFTLLAVSKEREIASDYKKQDLISQLSDDILISIIARLPTKEAVRTSILSNRWRSLYKFVPDVDFLCEHLVGRSVGRPHEVNTVINGVDRFLRLRSGFKIRSLELSCCLMKSNTFEQFIHSLGRLGIQRLVIYHSCCLDSIDLSFSCHFISQMPSLRFLELEGCSLRPMPTSVKLTQSNNNSSSLQLLRLNGIDVHAGALECILANCLSLHSLSIYGCNLPSNLSLCGPNLQLKSLWMACCEGVEEIELYASNLATFEINNPEVVNFIFDHVPKLQNMFVSFLNRNIMSSVCTKLVRDLPHLKSLIFHTKGDIYQVSSRTMGFNTFGNLRQLSLHLYLTKRVNLLSLAPFLERCPLLQEFHLDTEFLEYVDGGEVTRPVAVIHPELKKVEFTGHCGTKIEIYFALYILKSAICLEQMQIRRCSKWYHGCGRWMGRGKPKWSNETLEMIHGQLRGQAISKKARLTFQHSPIYEYNVPTILGNSVFDHADNVEDTQ